MSGTEWQAIWGALLWGLAAFGIFVWCAIPRDASATLAIFVIWGMAIRLQVAQE